MVLQKWAVERVWEVCGVRGRDGSKEVGEAVALVVLVAQGVKGEFL